MLSSLLKLKRKNKKVEAFDSILDGLKRLYRTKVLPVEEAYKFGQFHSPPLEEADFDAKPMIVLVGQYSTGKTTLVRYLLDQDYPGMHIGVEPTTDRFIAVMHPGAGTQHQTGAASFIPGHALVSDSSKNFRNLQIFGSGFLNRFQASLVNNDLLQNFTFIDTPGILSGEKQRENYDIFGVFEWFFERADRIILLFDAHKLDISDELHFIMQRMRRFDEKIRIILNKADRVDAQQLMRVYGALMWSLGKVLATPEVTRVYVGSFWNEPRLFNDNRKLFELEEADLFLDLQSLPRSAALRKLNDLIKRARLARTHAYVMAELKEAMPPSIAPGRHRKRRQLLAKLDQVFAKVSREHSIPLGDMPDVDRMRQHLGNYDDFATFSSIQPKLLKTLDDFLSCDVAQLMTLLPKEDEEFDDANVSARGSCSSTMATKHSLLFNKASSPLLLQQPSNSNNNNNNNENVMADRNKNNVDDDVFGVGALEGFDAGRNDPTWIVDKFRKEYDCTFAQLSIDNGKVPGSAAKTFMIQSKLPNPVLGRIWKLTDLDRDGFLDADEWSLANYLIKLRVEGYKLPSQLPDHLIPPSKRHREANTS